eukprot:scaffold8762_cov114-Isochrysis_galbana.AAC.3
MDVYDPDYVPNNSDAAGRYSYRQQPVVCEWNVRRLAHSLGPLLEGGQPAAEAAAVKAFWAEYKADYRRRFRDKLGLLVADEGAADDRLLSWLLDVMQISGADYTNVFRCLSRIEWEASEAACYRPPQVGDRHAHRSSDRTSPHKQAHPLVPPHTTPEGQSLTKWRESHIPTTPGPDVPPRAPSGSSPACTEPREGQSPSAHQPPPSFPPARTPPSWPLPPFLPQPAVPPSPPSPP